MFVADCIFRSKKISFVDDDDSWISLSENISTMVSHAFMHISSIVLKFTFSDICKFFDCLSVILLHLSNFQYVNHSSNLFVDCVLL